MPERRNAAVKMPGTATFKSTLGSGLGLKLEPRKAPIDLIVIDHLEKTPTEN